MSWIIKEFKKINARNPVLIEGLPGIGNVGKVAIDFLIDELDAKRIFLIKSFTLPHSVFINEQNLVELPKIEIFHKKINNQDFLFLAGDVQPTDEVSCYEFTKEILKICKNVKCNDLIALGGIGLADIPKSPKIYLTGNTARAVKKYKIKNLSTELYGMVGPIVGVSGLLLGMADQKMDAIALLAETYGHPMFLGVKGAKEVLVFLNNKFKLGIDIKKLDKEIKDIETEIIKRTEELSLITKDPKIKFGEVNYIG